MTRRAAKRNTATIISLLPVLAGFITADAHFTIIGTRGLQSTTLALCDTEYQACVADAECIEQCNPPSGCSVQCCNVEFLDDTTCDDLDQTICCRLEKSEECANNEAFIAYADCFFGAAGCSLDIGGCDVETEAPLLDSSSTGEVEPEAALDESGSTGGGVKHPAYDLAVAFVAAVVVVSAWGIM